MGGKKPLRRPLWPPTRATASNYYPLGLDGAGGAAKPLLRAPKKPAPLHGRLPAFSGAVDAFERARKCFLEWRYFFSIILSEFLKNRVALQKEKSCAKGLFDEKYNNNPKYSLIEGRLLPCLSFILSGLALCECNIGVASSVGVVKTKLGLAAHKLDRTVCLCDFLF